jgi:hypothetical protein
VLEAEADALRHRLNEMRHAYVSALDVAAHNHKEAELRGHLACAALFDVGLWLARGPKCYWCGKEDIGRTDDEVRAHVDGCAPRYSVAVAT